MRREGGTHGDLVVTWSELPRSLGHAYYDRLQSLLLAAGFDAFVEDACKPYYAPKMGTPSLCRQAAISACIWSAIMKGWIVSAASPGVVQTPIRCATFCGLRRATRFPTTPGYPRREAVCPKGTSRILQTEFAWAVFIVAVIDGEPASLAIAITPDVL